MTSTREKIAKQIKDAREKRKLTQAQVAKEADITVNYLAMVERAEVNVSSDILGRIGKALRIQIQI